MNPSREIIGKPSRCAVRGLRNLPGLCSFTSSSRLTYVPTEAAVVTLTAMISEHSALRRADSGVEGTEIPLEGDSHIQSAGLQ